MKNYLLRFFAIGFLFVGAPLLFAQSSRSVSVSLPRWQASSPLQVVGSGFGQNSMIDDVFVFNTSSTTVNRVRLAGQVFDAGSQKRGPKDCLAFLETAPIEVDIPPLTVAHLKKLSLWSASDLSRAFAFSKSRELVIRLGILSSNSENGVTFEAKTRETPFFLSAVGEENAEIDYNWQKFGSKQLIEKANSVDAPPKDALVSADLVDSCTANKFDYDTSWCKRTSQTSCLTFQCDNTQFCPKDSCRRSIE